MVVYRNGGPWWSRGMVVHVSLGEWQSMAVHDSLGEWQSMVV